MPCVHSTDVGHLYLTRCIIYKYKNKMYSLKLLTNTRTSRVFRAQASQWWYVIVTQSRDSDSEIFAPADAWRMWKSLLRLLT